MNKFASVIMLLAMSLSSAHAMTYSYRRIAPHKIVIDAAGVIENDETQTFVKWLKTYVKDNDDIEAIVLNSRGGSVDQALILGSLIDKFQINTGTPQGGVCASACVLVWAAGHQKSIAENSVMGVHEAFTNVDDPAKSISEDGTNSEINFLKKEGAPKNVISKLEQTAPPNIYILTKDDLTKWNTHIVKD